MNQKITQVQRNVEYAEKLANPDLWMEAARELVEVARQISSQMKERDKLMLENICDGANH